MVGTCIEGEGFPLTLKKQLDQIRNGAVDAVVKVEAQKVYIIWENRAQIGKNTFIIISLHKIYYGTFDLS
jgi:hypothetical protein